MTFSFKPEEKEYSFYLYRRVKGYVPSKKILIVEDDGNMGDIAKSSGFKSRILPLFNQNDVWASGSLACTTSGCHTGIGGAHDLDMGSYEG